MSELIGRIVATEKNPTTMDRFTFWTNANMKLHAFDIVKVQHIEGTFTFGVIENISHITDAQSFLTSFISSDFEDNATGIAKDKFRETLANIADSDKHVGEAKGFRGISGRRAWGLRLVQRL